MNKFKTGKLYKFKPYNGFVTGMFRTQNKTAVISAKSILLLIGEKTTDFVFLAEGNNIIFLAKKYCVTDLEEA